MAQFPTITYSNVKHKVDNGLSGGVVQVKDETITPVFNTTTGTMTAYRVSCVSPYNQITGNFTSNRALTRFEIRVNPIETTNYGPGIGNLAFEATTIAANTSRSFTIIVNSTTFAGSQTVVITKTGSVVDPKPTAKTNLEYTNTDQELIGLMKVFEEKGKQKKEDWSIKYQNNIIIN